MQGLAAMIEVWQTVRFSLSNITREKRAFSRLLLLGIIAVFCLNVYPALLTRFDYLALEERYRNWMANPGDLRWFITDSDLYAYAGWNYVSGVSPDKINFEHPPLAKYLIGLSAVVFSNPNAIGVALGTFSLLILYELSKKLLGRSLFALVPVYMLSLEKIFITFSSTSMLDIYLVFFLLLSILLFSHPHKYVGLLGGSVTLGLACACKLTAFLAIPSLIVPLIVRRKKIPWKLLLLSVLVAALAYCSTYAWFFVLGHSPFDFLELQWKMLTFQAGRRYGESPPAGRLLLTLLTGIAGPETRNLIYVDEISNTITVVTIHGLSMVREFNILTWPLCFSGAVLSSYQAARTRNTVLLQSCVYFFSFLIPFTVSQSFVWYLLPAFPIGMLLLTNNLKEIFEKTDRPVSYLVFLAYLAALFAWSRFIAFPSFIEL